MDLNQTSPSKNGKIAIQIRDLNIYYGSFRAVKHIDLDIFENQITAIIGSSGCGKSTMLRAINRMNELIPSARMEGKIIYNGENILGKDVDPVVVRSQIGMVFQKPNPFPKSVFDNVAWGAKANGFKGNLEELVVNSLKQAALWDDVKDQLSESALSLSNGQQQRLCIARTIAVKPEIILMDEPASALDPIATGKIEELMYQLAENYTIIIVTHNMQQAARASHYTAFLNMDDDQAGHLIEFGKSEQIFTNPQNEMTEAYITGRFG